MTKSQPLANASAIQVALNSLDTSATATMTLGIATFLGTNSAVGMSIAKMLLMSLSVALIARGAKTESCAVPNTKPSGAGVVIRMLLTTFPDSLPPALSTQKGATDARAAKIANVGAGTAVLIVTAATKLLGAGINGMATCTRMNSTPSTTTLHLAIRVETYSIYL